MPTGLGLYDLVEKLFIRAKRKEEEWTAAAIASLGLAHPFIPVLGAKDVTEAQLNSGKSTISSLISYCQSTNEGFPGDGDSNRAALIEAIEAGGEEVSISLYPAASTSKAVFNQANVFKPVIKLSQIMILAQKLLLRLAIK
ncbi:hypothetical protein RIF29_47024 [Crotalaria pallida]|uniref:Uncharacterized protein n=1 Tax=Crotalaria pallida TaxID=3830 RepID=A0AAN9DTR4_CROPI